MPGDSRIVQKGIAKVQTTAGALDAYPNIAIQSVKGKHNWENQSVKDFGGFEEGWDARNAHIIITVEFELTGTSQAAAITNGAFLLELAQVNISGADLPWLNATGVNGYFTGAWCYHEGGDINLSNTKSGSFTCMLRKYKDPTQNALQFVTPS
jgi:hypothetical protein